MSTVDTIQLELDIHITNANIIKELVTEEFVKQKIISEEQKSSFDNNYQIILFKRKWYEKWLKYIGFNNPNGMNEYQFKIVKF